LHGLKTLKPTLNRHKNSQKTFGQKYRVNSGHPVERDELQTIACKIEAIMNSHPLTHTHTTDNILCPIDLLNPYTQLRQTYNAKNKLIDIFCFSNEYVTALRERRQLQHRQSHSAQTIPKVDDIVMVHDKDVPRAQWHIGVIQTLHQSPDVPNRPLNSLYPLELHTDYQSVCVHILHGLYLQRLFFSVG
jgi:hypothetical protein